MKPEALQQAAADDQAEAPAPIVCTVAGPRVPVSSATYDGAELRVGATRPGAYDALRLPSLFNGRQKAPGSPIALVPSSVWTPPPPAPPSRNSLGQSTPELLAVMRREAAEREATKKRHVGTPRGDRQLTQLRDLAPMQRKARAEYRPQPGSVPDRVIKHLQATGGYLLHTEVVKQFGIQQNGLTSVFRAALISSTLVRVLVDGRVGLALPDYVPPPSTPKEPRGPKPTTPLERAQARLARAQADVQQLQAEAAARNE